MNLENSFYVFEGAVPARLCDDLVRYGEQQVSQMALTGDFEGKSLENEKDISKLYKTRNSSIVWMDDTWIKNAIIPFVEVANREAGWNFQLQNSEQCQWTKYAETQHYTWHQDSWPKPYNKPTENVHGLIRKLSVTVSLVDGSEYEGGDLEFDLRNTTDSSSNIITSQSARVKGSVTVFPSFIWHRVAPVTKGVRYSLVVWTLGRPFS